MQVIPEPADYVVGGVWIGYLYVAERGIPAGGAKPDKTVGGNIKVGVVNPIEGEGKSDWEGAGEVVIGKSRDTGSRPRYVDIVEGGSTRFIAIDPGVSKGIRATSSLSDRRVPFWMPHRSLWFR